MRAIRLLLYALVLVGVVGGGLVATIVASGDYLRWSDRIPVESQRAVEVAKTQLEREGYRRPGGPEIFLVADGDVHNGRCPPTEDPDLEVPGNVLCEQAGNWIVTMIGERHGGWRIAGWHIGGLPSCSARLFIDKASLEVAGLGRACHFDFSPA